MGWGVAACKDVRVVEGLGVPFVLKSVVYVVGAGKEGYDCLRKAVYPVPHRQLTGTSDLRTGDAVMYCCIPLLVAFRVYRRTLSNVCRCVFALVLPEGIISQGNLLESGIRATGVTFAVFAKIWLDSPDWHEGGGGGLGVMSVFVVEMLREGKGRTRRRGAGALSFSGRCQNYPNGVLEEKKLRDRNAYASTLYRFGNNQQGAKRCWGLIVDALLLLKERSCSVGLVFIGYPYAQKPPAVFFSA